MLGTHGGPPVCCSTARTVVVSLRVPTPDPRWRRHAEQGRGHDDAVFQRRGEILQGHRTRISQPSGARALRRVLRGSPGLSEFGPALATKSHSRGPGVGPACPGPAGGLFLGHADPPRPRAWSSVVAPGRPHPAGPARHLNAPVGDVELVDLREAAAPRALRTSSMRRSVWSLSTVRNTTMMSARDDADVGELIFLFRPGDLVGEDTRGAAPSTRGRADGILQRRPALCPCATWTTAHRPRPGAVGTS